MAIDGKPAIAGPMTVSIINTIGNTMMIADNTRLEKRGNVGKICN